MKTTITARICGNDYACAIPRDTLHLFESIHGSANALLARVRAGAWTAAELASIIDYAIAPPKASAAVEGVLLRNRHNPASIAEPAFIANGAAAYAPLVIGLLLAVLYGLPDGVADFTDEANGEDA